MHASHRNQCRVQHGGEKQYEKKRLCNELPWLRAVSTVECGWHNRKTEWHLIASAESQT